MSDDELAKCAADLNLNLPTAIRALGIATEHRITAIVERDQARRERDAALAAMWGMICEASNRQRTNDEWRGLAMKHADRLQGAGADFAATAKDRDEWRELALRHEQAGRSCA